jgi:amino acid permease
MKIRLFIVALVIMTSGGADARHRHYGHHHYRHNYERMPMFSPGFCSTIVEAFSHYDVKDLDKFVDSIPTQRRVEARKCLGKD